MLFFITPSIALQSAEHAHAVDRVWQRLKCNCFSNLVLLFLGMVPLFFLVGLLIFAAVLTGKSYFEAQKTIEVGFQWFFIMFPFCILLAPAVIFFFNFSAECHALMIKKIREEGSH
jgi:hypothetical protein